MSDEQAVEIIRELATLRKLRLFELFERGYSQAQLANVLGVNQSTISRMMPSVGKKKKKPVGNA